MSIQQLARLSITVAFIYKSLQSPSHTHQLHRCVVQRRCSNSYNNIINNNNFNIEAMPRGVKKENLPVKTCVVCGRPFNWRKKWEKVWEEVTTCSKSCNRKRKEKNRQQNRTIDDSSILVDSFAESASDDEEHLLSSICNDVQAMEMDNVGGAMRTEDDSAIRSDDEDSNHDDSSSSRSDPIADAKAKRKAEKKRKKAERRAQREGRGDPTAGQKQCTLCAKSVNLLIRCQHDKSGEWAMVCGTCWNDVSGGVVDGDEAHPYYRYGGLWKNRRAQT